MFFLLLLTVIKARWFGFKDCKEDEKRLKPTMAEIPLVISKIDTLLPCLEEMKEVLMEASPGYELLVAARLEDHALLLETFKPALLSMLKLLQVCSGFGEERCATLRHCLARVDGMRMRVELTGELLCTPFRRCQEADYMGECLTPIRHTIYYNHIFQ